MSFRLCWLVRLFIYLTISNYLNYSVSQLPSLSPLSLYVVVPEYPTAYALINHWSAYLQAISASNATSPDPATCPSADLSFGLLGSPGFACGAFLVSPIAAKETQQQRVQPDIQLTVFPTVMDFYVYILYSVFCTACCIDWLID